MMKTEPIELRPPQPHAATPEALCAALAVLPDVGLSDEEAQQRRARHGENRLPEPPHKSELLRFLRQLSSPLVLVLIAAALIATVIGVSGRSGSLLVRFGDALAILLIVLLNALLGFYQEQRAESALQALNRLSVPRARVLRGGALRELAAVELVPGDIIELGTGDAVPADARLLTASDLRLDESALTGESGSVTKEPQAVLAADTPLAERLGMAYLGTFIVHGKGRAVVAATAGDTELGRIALAIGSQPTDETPLEATLAGFGKRVLWVCIAVSAILFAWGLFRGKSGWHLALLQSVSFAVALIPEGLPAITAIALALGTQRMARRGVIVRRLPAVEALGATSVICTDKTGTLTQNRMAVRAIYLDGQRLSPAATASPALRELLETAVLCNDATLTATPTSGPPTILGDPTEAALLRAASDCGLALGPLLKEHPRLAELPFDSDRKRMVVLSGAADGSRSLHVKGSVESVLPLCRHCLTEHGVRPLTDEDRQSIQRAQEQLGSEALRVLLLAKRSGAGATIEESELTLLGLVGLLDPPREGVREAIAACRRAGVSAVMITGDHPGTAAAIGREIGLLTDGDELLSGSELGALDSTELGRRCQHTRVFARTTATQKLRIVEAFQQLGHVVAMTGDGVNDAPALRQAHVGIAMGRDGTEVARQASDVVLTDDNFATVVAGIREGRAIYHNIQKFIVYLLSSNFALALAVFATTFRSDALPLTALMILWINLVTNGLPALALGIELPDPAQMESAPRRPEARLLQPLDYLGIALAGSVMGLLSLGLYAAPLLWPSKSPEGAQTMAFALLGFSPLFHVWNCRSRDRSLFAQRPLVPLPLFGAALLSAGVHLLALAVPLLRPVFHTVPLSLSDWLLVLGLSASVLPAVELTKLLGRPILRRAAPPAA